MLVLINKVKNRGKFLFTSYLYGIGMGARASLHLKMDV